MSQHVQFHFKPGFYFNGSAVAASHNKRVFASVAVPGSGGKANASVGPPTNSKVICFSSAEALANGERSPNGRTTLTTTVTAKVQEFKYRSYSKGHPVLFTANCINAALFSELPQDSTDSPRFYAHRTNTPPDFEHSDFEDPKILGFSIVVDLDHDGLLRYGSKKELKEAWGRLKSQFKHRFGLEKRHSDVVGLFGIPDIHENIVYSIVRRIRWENEEEAMQKLGQEGIEVQFGEVVVSKEKGKIVERFQEGEGHIIRIKEKDGTLSELRLGEVIQSDRSARLVMLRIRGSAPQQPGHSNGYGSGDATVGEVRANGHPA